MNNKPLAKLPKFLYLQGLGLYVYGVTSLALVVYSLGFLTHNYLFYAYGDANLLAFYDSLQWANREFLSKALIMVMFTCLFFMLQLHRYGAGPITLVLTLLLVGGSVVFAVLSLGDLNYLKQDYLELNFSSLARYTSYKASTFTFNLGLVLWAVSLLASLKLLTLVVFNAFKEKI